MRAVIFPVLAMAVLLPAPMPDQNLNDGNGALTIMIECSAFSDSYWHWMCTFYVASSNQSAIFFRWDFDADGQWDYPDQTGGGPIGKWTVETEVTKAMPHAGFLRVCVQGWDGVSARLENGTWVPVALMACTEAVIGGDFVVRPNRWSHESGGRWVSAFYTPPEGFGPGGAPHDVELEGVLAVPSPPWVPQGKGPGGYVVMFKVDRVALTDRLGPGTHTVHLRGVWDGTLFLAGCDVTIL